MALQDLRKARRESMIDVAQATGIDPATIWRLETGRSSGSTRVLRALAQHFGVPIEDLFDEEVPA
jgi:transcriptional regulator with XRE-family HTH domain